MLKRICVLVTLLVPLGMLASAQVAASRRVALGDWPEARGPNRDGVSDEKGLHREVGAERPELPVARAVRRPLGADRHGQPRLRAEPVRPRRRRFRSASWRSTRTPARWSGNTSSTSSRATCRRTASAGPRRPPIPKPATSTRSASARRSIALEQGRQAAVGPLDRRGVRRVHHARRPHDVADRRRRSGDRQRRDLELGHAGQPRAPLHRARQADRRHRLGRQPGRPSLRHGVRGADHRDDQRPAAADLRHSATAAIHAIKPQTGEKVWSFVAAKRAINTGVVVKGTTVIVSHGDENLDTQRARA